jgi:hypothetical protein
MIAYDLQCANGHNFEGWFEDGRAYETQEKKGLISCPVCHDASVYRIPSTFAIKSSPEVKDVIEKSADLKPISEKVVDFVEKNFDNVGSDFTKEALKMHYGVTEARNIRGFSTKKEENTLKKEGIQFFKIPMPVASDTDA